METVTGEVVQWSGDEGWGALRSSAVPSDVFVQFSDLETAGWATLSIGQRLEFQVEHYLRGQDEYIYRAHRIRILR
ncbi:hypothetical protein RU06_05605 [Curtobacterium flaccumfaciens]|nr:hypothetical protein RU06_05605 [Curtobacterium flaccumfaciens]